MQPFHLAFPTTDLAATRAFMVDTIGAGVGREATRWVDFDLFGHQVTAHLVPSNDDAATNPVDGHSVPAFHFGVVLAWDDWEVPRCCSDCWVWACASRWWSLPRHWFQTWWAT